MFLSGHPLDHYKFELKHYGITSVAEFNEFKEAVGLQPNSNRLFRLVGLVTTADHKISRKGK
jgi:DNA polymerase-3 subunit alpha